MDVVNRELKEIPQFTRARRHRWARWEHGTVRKWENFGRARVEKKLKRVRLTSLPHFAVIDPCNYCQLRCPLCPTGISQLHNRHHMLSLAHFQKYFDPLAPYLFEVFLYNWGESLLNPHVYSMIDYAQKNNVGTNLSSNFMDVSLTNLLDSGLEYLVVSLDGTNQTTYGKYRINGDFDTVYENMAELIRKRNATGKRTPRVEWQFIVMRHNEHQMATAEQMARRAGVDLLRFIPVALQVLDQDRGRQAAEWFPRSFPGRKQAQQGIEQQMGQADKPGPCFYLYDTMTINPTGGVHPCCVVYKHDTEFGQFPENGSLRSFWNNDKYQSGRRLFSHREAENRVSVPCDACDLFTKHKSKAEEPTREVQQYVHHA